MERTIKTKKLPRISEWDSTDLQIGYYLNGHWIGVHNIYRRWGGWQSDQFSGWHKTITEWKVRTSEYLNSKVPQ